MKKIIPALVGILSLSALTQSIEAQGQNNVIAYTDTRSFRSSVRDLAVMETPEFLGVYSPDEKKINVKAITDFKARFHSADNTQWFYDQNGYVSYFRQNGFFNRAYYDTKGRWKYSLLFYSEDRMPKEVRNTIKQNYYDMKISIVEEVQTLDGTGYVVFLEDNSKVKIVKINQAGEMDTMQEFNR